jgi:TetR/AcrR family tetracycline transcriptional repressor
VPTQTAGTKMRRGKAEDAPELNREVIVNAALNLIDEQGLDSFSLRTLSQKLGVYPTAIYWYVPNRNELVALVVAQVLSAIPTGRSRRNWQNRLRDLFQDYRAAVAAHPNVAPLVGVALVSNTSMSFTFVEHILDIGKRAGLADLQLVATYNTIIAALVGFVAQEFAPMPSEDAIAWQLSVQQHLLSVDRDRFPLLSANLGLLSNRAFTLRWQNGGDAPLDESYRIFVEVIIRGIEALASEQHPPATDRPTP